MAENGSDKEKLTPAQLRAIVALLETRTVEDAAKKASVGTRTLYRWLAEDKEFNARLRSTEDFLIGGAVRRLLGLNSRAIDVLKEILNDEEKSDSVRLRAAVTTLDMALKLRELRNVEDRLGDIERQLAKLAEEKDSGRHP